MTLFLLIDLKKAEMNSQSLTNTTTTLKGINTIASLSMCLIIQKILTDCESSPKNISIFNKCPTNYHSLTNYGITKYNDNNLH